MPEQIGDTTSLGFFANLFTPTAVIMLTFAIFIDAGEAFFELIPIVGTTISIIIDVIALVLIGAWMYVRSGQITVPEKTGERIKGAMKSGKKYKWLKPFCMGFEMIPIISSFAPLWIVAVLIELAEERE